MGINDFFNVTIGNKIIADFGVNITLGKLRGSRLAIDGNLISYMCMMALTSERSLTDTNGNITTHLKIISNKVFELNKHGINQIWIFDNPSRNARKAETHEIRRKARGVNAHGLKSNHIAEIQEMFSLMGIEYVIAPPGVEAEQYAAWLTEGVDPYCDYVLSKDSDVLLFGGNLLRVAKSGNKTIYEQYRYRNLLDDMNITHDELEIMCTALGHDFFNGIRGIGKKTVYKKTKEGKITLNDEAVVGLEQFRLNPDDYLYDVERSHTVCDKEAAIAWFIERSFDENLIRKKLNEFIC